MTENTIQTDQIFSALISIESYERELPFHTAFHDAFKSAAPNGLTGYPTFAGCNSKTGYPSDIKNVWDRMKDKLAQQGISTLPNGLLLTDARIDHDQVNHIFSSWRMWGLP